MLIPNWELQCCNYSFFFNLPFFLKPTYFTLCWMWLVDNTPPILDYWILLIVQITGTTNIWFLIFKSFTHFKTNRWFSCCCFKILLITEQFWDILILKLYLSKFKWPIFKYWPSPFACDPKYVQFSGGWIGLFRWTRGVFTRVRSCIFCVGLIVFLVGK